MRNMIIQNNHKKTLSYLLFQKVILFLVFYEYLNRLRHADSNAYDTDAHFNSSFPQALGGDPNFTGNSGCPTKTLGHDGKNWDKSRKDSRQAGMTKKNDDSYGYDANGNMNSRNGVSITWNYDNLPSSINSTVFVYDFSGQRVKKNATIYIGKLYECTGGSCTKYIFAGSNRIAYKTGSATYYYHTDHLGSSSIITNASGTKVNELYYYPYGKTRYALDSSLAHQFTGQELDDETGLYYYGARYYDPAIGRFVSADSIVPDPSNPQDLNRYSYAGNNPLLYTDPTGHFKFEDLFKTVVSTIVGVATFALFPESAPVTAKLILSGMVAGGTHGAMSGREQNIFSGAVIGGISAAIGYGLYKIPDVGPYIGLGAGVGVSYATGGWEGLANFGLGLGTAAVAAAIISPDSGSGVQSENSEEVTYALSVDDGNFLAANFGQRAQDYWYGFWDDGIARGIESGYYDCLREKLAGSWKGPVGGTAIKETAIQLGQRVAPKTATGYYELRLPKIPSRVNVKAAVTKAADAAKLLKYGGEAASVLGFTLFYVDTGKAIMQCYPLLRR